MVHSAFAKKEAALLDQVAAAVQQAARWEAMAADAAAARSAAEERAMAANRCGPHAAYHRRNGVF